MSSVADFLPRPLHPPRKNADIPPSRSRSDIYRLFVAVRQLGVMFSSLPPRYNMEFLSVPPRANPKNTNCVRERLTPKAWRKQAVSQILSGRRRDHLQSDVHTIFVILLVYENLVIKWVLIVSYNGTLWRYRLSVGHLVFIQISRVRLPVASQFFGFVDLGGRFA